MAVRPDMHTNAERATVAGKMEQQVQAVCMYSQVILDHLVLHQTPARADRIVWIYFSKKWSAEQNTSNIRSVKSA